ncbi:MAG: TMEM175 family protein [Methanoregula sp.]|nr:TMEM175 family protein [Methanoregula sp.]
MTEKNADWESMHLTKSRLESLSDGIFAFAMTLLVIGLNLPDKSTVVPTQVFAMNYIFSLYSDFFHYVLAFLILGAFWLSHHIEVHPLRSLNRIYIWLNLGTLMFVAMLPFSTSFSGDFHSVSLGAIIFELNLFAIGMGMYFQWIYATGNNRLVEPGDLDSSFIRHIGIHSLVVPALSVIGILIALTGSLWSTIVYLFIPVVGYLIKRMESKGPESSG